MGRGGREEEEEEVEKDGRRGRAAVVDDADEDVDEANTFFALLAGTARPRRGARAPSMLLSEIAGKGRELSLSPCALAGPESNWRVEMPNFVFFL